MVPQTSFPTGDFLLTDQQNYLPDDILYKTDRMSMAHRSKFGRRFSITVLLNCCRLPHDLKIRGSKLKFVLRELMRDKLPPSVLRRKKEGFDIPTHHWLRTVLKPLLLDTITRERVEGTGVFHWPAVERVMRDHLERRANYGYHLWGLLTLFLWAKTWSIQGTRSDIS
ncbi:MAG: asparagine synthase-related protein [Bryobacteraceae bacterium]